MNPRIPRHQLGGGAASHALRRALGSGIHFADDRQPALDDRPHANLLDHLRSQRAKVEGERRLRNRTLTESHVVTDCRSILILGNPPMLLHHGKDVVATGAHEIRPFPRIVAIRRAHDAGQQRRFVEPQLRRQLVEIQPGGFIDPEYRLSAVVTEVDIVQIDLQDLVLGHPRVQEYCEHHLHEFAPPRPLLGEKAGLDDLLIDGAAALGDPARPQVGKQGPGNTDRVKAEVMPEPNILGGDERIGDVAGKGGEGDGRRDAPIDTVKGGHRAPGGGCRGEDHCRLSPGVVDQLAGQTAVHDEHVDGQSLEGGEDNHRENDRPLLRA